MSCEQNIKEIITWLEKNQPDVFKRGLWDVIKPVEHHPSAPDFDAALEKAWIEHVKRYYSGIEPDIPQPKIKYTQAFRNGWDARGDGK